MVEFGGAILDKMGHSKDTAKWYTLLVFSEVLLWYPPESRRPEAIIPKDWHPAIGIFIEHGHKFLIRCSYNEYPKILLKSFSLIPLQLIKLMGINTTDFERRITWESYQRYTLRRSVTNTEKGIAETLEYLSNLPFAQHMKKYKKPALVSLKRKLLVGKIRSRFL